MRPGETATMSRRTFMASTGAGAATFLMAGSALAALLPPSSPDVGGIKNGKVAFPNLKAKSEQPGSPPPNPLPWEQRVGVAVVGLGRLSVNQILPAFGTAKNAKLTALVSGSPDKMKTLAAQYGVPDSGCYSYERFDEIVNNPDVQYVYIVLPNAMHRNYVERAARAGKHILCEKPMATNVEDARAMVAVCKEHNVKLMIAYRCQYEPYNLEVVKRLRDGKLGDIRFIEAFNTQNEGEPDQWRLKAAMAGGGALPDIGLYCLNAARYLTGEEPDQVFAYLRQDKSDPRFREVEEGMSFTLRFPSGVLANCVSSYDAHDDKTFKVHLEKGHITLNGAFEYSGKQLLVTQRAGDATGVEEVKLGEKDQFALELDHMAECVMHDITPRTPGEEGLQDQIIMEALYRSAATGMPVDLDVVKGKDVTRGPALKQDS